MVRRNRLLAVVALILLGPLAGLTALAYASPPDPSWIGGFYDGDDQDDVVTLITLGTDAVAVSVEREPVRDPVGCFLPPLGPVPRLSRPIVSLQSRAPPA